MKDLTVESGIRRSSGIKKAGWKSGRHRRSSKIRRHMIRTEGAVTIQTDGTIRYITDGVTVVDERTVRTPESASAVIFK